MASIHDYARCVSTLGLGRADYHNYTVSCLNFTASIVICKQFLGQYVVLVVFRSLTFVFLILDFNSFYFLWRTSLKTTCLRDGCFLPKDCFIIFIYSNKFAFLRELRDLKVTMGVL